MSGQTPVKELYVGRAFLDALHVAGRTGATLHVVSAGLGLVDGAYQAPAYDLTTASGVGSIDKLLGRLGCTPADWWNALATARSASAAPVSSLVNDEKRSLVLLALPSTYIDLILGDLDQVTPGAESKLRIFTSPLGAAALPTRLRECVLPYDGRLEATGFAGTQADFPQRAMRHFVEALSGMELTPAAAHQAVSDSLRGLAMRDVPARVRASDDEIISLLRAHWVAYGGNSARLLRFLRDRALVACEQSRFRGLWHSVRDELKP